MLPSLAKRTSNTFVWLDTSKLYLRHTILRSTLNLGLKMLEMPNGGLVKKTYLKLYDLEDNIGIPFNRIWHLRESMLKYGFGNLNVVLSLKGILKIYWIPLKIIYLVLTWHLQWHFMLEFHISTFLEWNICKI